MPLLDPNAQPLLSPDALFSKYHKLPYEFYTQIKKIQENIHIIVNPLEYSRLLQIILQPHWYSDYVQEGPSSEFRSALASALQRVGARFTLHHQSDLLSCREHDIRLTWHTLTKEKNLWNYKEAALPHMVSCDRSGYAGWSELAELTESEIMEVPAEMANLHYDTEIISWLNTKNSKYRQDTTQSFEESNFVFFPLQIEGDTVVKLLYYGKYLETVEEIADCILSAGNRLVVKRHPLCDSSAMGALIVRLMERGAISTKASIHEILPRCKSVVTMNSGVGFEALLYLKKVICFGKSEYNIVSGSIKNSQELKNLVEMIRSYPDTDKIKKYLFLALKKYQVNTKSSLALDQHVLKILANALLIAPRGAKIK